MALALTSFGGDAPEGANTALAETRRIDEGPARAVPVDEDAAGPLAPAPGRSAIAASGSGFVKGWIEAGSRGRLDVLPEGARAIEPYDDRIFAEMPEEAVAGLAARGLRFTPVEDADLLSAGGERFDVRGGEPAIAAEWRAAAPDRRGRRPYLVKFDAPVKPEWLADLETAGFEAVQYEAHFGYLVFAPPDAETRLRGVGRVAFGGEYHPAYKASAALRARAAGDETINLNVLYFDLPGYEKKIDEVLRGGARLMTLSDGEATSQWKVIHFVTYENVRTRDLPAILREPEVYWAEEWLPPQVEDERAAQISAGNFAGGVPSTGYHAWLTGLGADGAGVTVAVADTGFDTGDVATLHDDLQGRTAFATALCSNNDDPDGHGTNTASIALGDPRLPNGTGILDAGGFFWGAGSAPGSSLYVQKALNPTDCGIAWAGNPTALASDATKNGGAEIGSHSFQDGLTPGNGYTSTAVQWDARVRDSDPNTAGLQPYSVVFSAGNSGPAAGSLTSPKAAKNMVVVGASENYRPGQCPGVGGCGGSADDIDALVDFTSRGPTVDGRIRPDVSAPGHVIAGSRSSVASYSCACDGGAGTGCCASTGVDGSNQYSAYSGTSQAAPRVAGASAIVHDWFLGQFGAFPSPAMNKAILINGAVDMKAPDVPNNNEGWGRINLARSLQSPLPSRYTDQSFVIGATGDPSAFTANYFIQDPTSPLKATLVWTDPAGAASCNPCLVNDLDLFVTQGPTTWRGNNFTAGFTNTGAVADTRNNVEGINLAGNSLTCASFQVKVRAQTLAGDGLPGNPDTTDQDFALVVANAALTPGPAKMASPSSGLGAGCDADAFLDRRETADLTLQLRNVGCDNATGVQATLSVDSSPPGTNVTVSPAGAETIGSVAAAATVPHTWQVSLADFASSLCGQKARFRVDFTDAASHAWSDFVDVILDANSFTQVTNTDNASTDNSFSKQAEWNLDNCRTTSSPTSWHMGQGDCTGIIHDGTSQDLIFAFNLASSDIIKELSFTHAFGGYSNSMVGLRDSVQVAIDPENDGSYVTLQTWQQGINNPTTMTLAGPIDLTPYNAGRANTIKVRFRFQGGANWSLMGPNSAPGWDVDDIVFKYDTAVCDAGSCAACGPPSGLTNNGAADPAACSATGVDVTWAASPASWNDAGGTRSYTVLRDGSPVASGPCSGAIAFGTTSCTDTSAVPGTSYSYQVRYNNGCGGQAATAGAPASDAIAAAPSGLANNAAADADACLTSGVNVSWAQDPAAWNDGGGTRTYTVLRDGLPVASGPCAGALAYGTTACTDTTAGTAVPHSYQVRYQNGCAFTAATAGAAATDQNCAPPEVNDGSVSGNPLAIDRTGISITLTWDASPGATRYNVYAGTIGSFYSHAIFAATGLDGPNSCFEPATSVTFDDPSPGVSQYYLVAADNGIVESDLGGSPMSDPRPYASPACSPH